MSWRVEIEQTCDEDGNPVVCVEGDVDLSTSTALQQILRSLRWEGWRRVVVDLALARCVDSSGIRVLAEARQELREDGGTLVLANCPTRLSRALGILGLPELLDEVSLAG